MDKLDVYAGLGVAEVWIFENGRFSIHGLVGRSYEQRERSRFFPELDFAVLAEHAMMQDQDDAVRAYWARLKA